MGLRGVRRKASGRWNESRLCGGILVLRWMGLFRGDPLVSLSLGSLLLRPMLRIGGGLLSSSVVERGLRLRRRMSHLQRKLVVGLVALQDLLLLR